MSPDVSHSVSPQRSPKGAPKVTPKGTTDASRLRQIEREYREMPGLSLTVRQAGRLWHLTPPQAAALLDELVEAAVLSRTSAGTYGLRPPRP